MSDWIRVGPNPMTGALMRREKFRHKDTKGECHMTIEAEIGDMQLQTKKHQELPATTRSYKRGTEQTDSPSENQPC